MIVSVAGGKGGTGKTFLSTSLAVAARPARFLDCDVEEPNAHVFLAPSYSRWERVSITVPAVRSWKVRDAGKLREAAAFCRYNALAVVRESLMVFEELCTGCGGCFRICPEGYLRRKDHAVGTVKTGTSRDGMDFIMGELKVGEQRTAEVIEAVRAKGRGGGDTIIDCPPGSGRPALAAVGGSDFCILVTEPTPFGLHDLAENMELLRMLDIPVGVIKNRSGGAYRKVEEYCREREVPVLLDVPFTIETARAAAEGRTLIDIDPSSTEKLAAIWSEVRERVA